MYILIDIVSSILASPNSRLISQQENLSKSQNSMVPSVALDRSVQGHNNSQIKSLPPLSRSHINGSCFDKMNSSTLNNSKDQNAAIFMQERQPQMPVHSSPKSLTGKAKVFRRCL